MSESEKTINNGEKTVKMGLSSGIKIANSGKDISKSIFLGSLSIETLYVLGLTIVIIIIPLILISIIPAGSLFQTKADMDNAETKIASAVASSYCKEIESSKHQILSFMQQNYSDANVTLNDITKNSDGFSIDNNTCSVTVSFAPSAENMATNITAYANAVNATLAFYSDQKENEPVDFNGNAVTVDKEGNINLTDKAKVYINEHTTELTNAGAEEFLNSVGLHSASFFVYDIDESRWELQDFHRAPKTHIEVKTRIIPDGADPKTGEIKYKMEEYEVEITEIAWYGHINIIMFYDLSGYKSKELDACIKSVEEITIAGNSVSDATTLVGNTLETYYNSYITYSNGHFEDGKFIEGADSREEIFSKLLDDGTLMYIPISGLSSKFAEGEPGYSGDIEFNQYDNKTSSQIWSDISSLRNAGLIGSGTAMWNCTAFAEAWFYEIYDVDALYGNGCNMVENLLKSDFGKENFYRGSSPAPGGIFSIGSAYGANHVGCIDAVDYENKTITFSEGNTNGTANSTSTIRIKKTMTFDEFRTYINALKMATTGSSSGWITFANPKENISR